MGIWQMVFVGWMLLGLGVNLAKHGETRMEKYNFGTALLSVAIQIGILWAGGFFG